MSNISQFMRKVRLKTESITASNGQTVFNFSTVSIPNSDQQLMMLFINGKKQPNDAYTINSPTQITIVEGLELDDLLEIAVTGFN